MTKLFGDAVNTPANIRYYRRITILGGSVYLFWWFAVEKLLVNPFNPLPSRLFICSLFFYLFF